MRLISYNILDGGEGRADPLAEVILAQKPDIVALVEADDLSVVERIAGRTKMDFIHAPGKDHASALLSRWPIARTINHAALTKKLTNSLLQATVREPNGQEWTVGVLHLHPHSNKAAEQEREVELKYVLKAFRKHRKHGNPHLLCGDFNANAPWQQIDPDKCKPRTRDEWSANGGGVPRRVIDQLIRHGYIDTLRASNPGLAATAGTFSTQFPGQKVDYIFSFGIDPGLIRDAWVETDRLATYASDHYPVCVEIESQVAPLKTGE